MTFYNIYRVGIRVFAHYASCVLY